MGASSSATAETKTTKTIDWIWDDQEGICQTFVVQHPSGSKSFWHATVCRRGGLYSINLNCWDVKPKYLLRNGGGLLCEYSLYFRSDRQLTWLKVCGGVKTFSKAQKEHEDVLRLQNNLAAHILGREELVREEKLQFQLVLQIEGTRSSLPPAKLSPTINTTQPFEEEQCQ